MRKESDSIDQALKSLQNEQWTTSPHRQELESKLMAQFNTPRAVTGGRHYRSLIVTLAALLIGGAGFAAAGGPEMVKKWFVTVRLVGPNGETFDGMLEPISTDENAAEMTIETDDGTETTISVRKLNVEPTREGGDLDAPATMVRLMRQNSGGDETTTDAQILVPEGETGSIIIGSVPDETKAGSGESDGGEFVELALTVDGHETEAGEVVQVNVDMGGPDSAHLQSRALRGVADALAELEPIETWYDEEGILRELFLLPFGKSGDEQAGFNVLMRRGGAGEEASIGVVGTMTGVDPVTTQLVDVEWTLAGEATLQFETAEGKAIGLTVDPAATDQVDRLHGEMKRVRLQRLSPDDR